MFLSENISKNWFKNLVAKNEQSKFTEKPQQPPKPTTPNFTPKPQRVDAPPSVDDISTKSPEFTRPPVHAPSYNPFKLDVTHKTNKAQQLQQKMANDRSPIPLYRPRCVKPRKPQRHLPSKAYTSNGLCSIKENPEEEDDKSIRKPFTEIPNPEDQLAKR